MWGNRAALDPLGERFPFDKLHDQKRLAFGFFETVKCRYPWMIERGKKPRFPLETGQLLRMLRELFGKDFDGDFTPELSVPGAVDLAHSARTDGGEDLVGSKARTGFECHLLYGGT